MYVCMYVCIITIMLSCRQISAECTSISVAQNNSFTRFYGEKVASATQHISCCRDVRHALALYESEASYDHEVLRADSLRILVLRIVSLSTNSKGFTSTEGVKCEWGRKNQQLSASKSPNLGNGARQNHIFQSPP